MEGGRADVNFLVPSLFANSIPGELPVAWVKKRDHLELHNKAGSLIPDNYEYLFPLLQKHNEVPAKIRVEASLSVFCRSINFIYQSITTNNKTALHYFLLEETKD